MVAVVSGNGLGLFNTSLTDLGGLQGGMAGLGTRGSQVVNITNGNLILQDQDESLFVRGLSTGVLRTYNSRGTVAGMGQDAWMTGYERKVALTTGTLNLAGSQMTLYTGDGQAQIFTYSSNNTYISTNGEGAHDSLVWSGTNWTFTEGSSLREEQYASHADPGLLGRLIRIRDLKSDGSTPAEFEVIYSDNSASARITEIRSIDGAGAGADAILFGYDGSNRLTSITTREGGVIKGQVSYGYDAYDRLSWVQQDLTPTNDGDNTWDSATLANNNGLRFRTTYTYVNATDLLISSVTQSDGTTASYTYETTGARRVLSITQGSASDGSAQTVTFTYNDNSTDVKDSLDRIWTYQYDANKRLTAILAPAVSGQRDTTTYTYDSAGNVTQVKTVSGATTLSQTDQSFDANGNMLWQWTRVDGANASSIAVQRTYNSANQVLTETRYTGLDVDGPAATQSPNGGLTSNYIYDAQNRLRFSVDATGAVTERSYATSGNGIGQLASTRVYFGGAYASTMTELALNSWATTTQKASSQLTEFAYDVKGRLLQSVSFASVDGNGVGITDVADDRSRSNDISRYTYDAQGLLLQKVTVRGATRSTDTSVATPSGSEVIDYVYDGMGRLLGTLARTSEYAGWGSNPTNAEMVAYLNIAANDFATVSTIYSYADSSRQITVTLDSGATRTETRSLAGQTTNVSESGQILGSTVTRTTQRFYDAAGQLRGSEDPSGARRYFFYDNKGRLEAEVDATGAVTKYVYDGADRRISTIQYANRVTTTSWLSGSTVTVTNFAAIGVTPDTNNDRTTTNTFDLAGRLLTQTNGVAGSIDRQITTYSYDAAGRVTLVRTTDSLGTAATARETRQIYDNAGRLLAKVDAENFVTEYQYDVSGRLVGTIVYATATTTPTATTVAALRPTLNAANDQSTRYFYNGRGQQIGSLDALGYLTESIVDEEGNTRAQRRYAKQLIGLAGNESFLILKTAASVTQPLPTELYRESKSAYNGLGQLVTQTNYEDTVTRFTYDEAGRLVRTQTAENTSEVRESFNRYNVFNELIGQISGQQVQDLATANLLGGLLLNDPTLSETQLNAAYKDYGMTHSYDALSRRIESIDAEGNKTFYFYDSEGNQTFVVRGVAQNNAGVSGLRNSYGEVTETRYSAFGQVIDSITYTGRITIAVPGDRASVQSTISTLSFGSVDTRRQFAYDQRGLLKQSIDALNISSNYSYNAFGQLFQEVRANGTGVALTIQHNYDKRGLETSRNDAVGSSYARTNSQAYDAFGRVVASTDARGAVTSFTYDRLGRQITRSLTVTSDGITHPETTTLIYDAFDRTTRVTDALGNYTMYAYSDINRSLIVTSQEGVVITTVHNRHGQTLTVKDGNNATSTVTYDKNGAVLTSTNALNQSSSNTYDVRGLLYESTDATGRKVRYTYDAVGRVLSRIEDPGSLNLTTTTMFDGQGRQVQITDATGRVTAMSYDKEGRLVQTAQDPSGLNLRTSYSYNALGHQITVVEGVGSTNPRTVEYIYDVLGRRAQEIVDPGMGRLDITTHYFYDANDNVVQRNDDNGNISRFIYDEANRRVYDVDAAGGVSKTTYDAGGRVIAVRSYATAITISDLSTTAGIAASVIKTRVDAIANDATDQLSYRVYDRDSRVRFSVTNLTSTTASVTETRYDNVGRVSQTNAYTGSITISAGLKTKLQTGDVTALTDVAALLQTRTTLAFDSGFDANSLAGFSTSAGVAPTMTNGQVVFDQNAAVSGYAFPVIVTNDRYTLSQGLTFSVEFSTQSNLTNTSMELGLNNEIAWLQPGYRREGIAVQNGTLYRRQINGSDNQNVAIMTLSANTTYVVEIETQDGLVTTYVYAKGTDRSQGISFSANSSSASYGSSYWYAAGLQQSGVSGGSITLDNFDVNSRNNAQIQANRYDAAGRLIRSLDALGNATEYGYDAAGRRISVTDARGFTSYVVYDSAGRAKYSIDALGTVSESVFDASGRVITQRMYASAIAINSAALDSLRSNLRNGTATLSQISNLLTIDNTRDRQSYVVYDNAGRQSFTVDAAGNVNEMRYDAAGRAIETLGYLAQLQTAEFNAVRAGTATTATFTSFVSTNAGNARASKMVYDSAGRMTYTLTRSNTTSNVAVVSERRYNALGQVVADVSYGVTISYGAGSDIPAMILAINGATGHLAQNQRITRYAYDAEGHLRFTINNAGEVSEQRFNALGQVTQSLRYGQAISVSNATEANIAAAVVGQQGVRFSTNTYDVAGRLSSTTDALNGVETYTYNATGQVLTRTNKLGNTWTYSYDAQGRQTEERSPQIMVARFVAGVLQVESKPVVSRTAYDAVGNVVSYTENAEAVDTLERRTTRYQYDARGRQIRTIFPDAYRLNNSGVLVATNTQPTIEVTYNALDQAVVQKDVRGNYTYKVYDVLGRAAHDIDAEGYVTSYSYNAYGEQTGLKRFANKLVTTGVPFTSAGWIAGSAISALQVQGGITENSASDRTLTTSYDARGLKTQVQQSLVSYIKANGQVASGSPTTEFVYDAYSQLVQERVLLEGSPGTDAVWAETYHYFDILGRQTVNVNAEGYVSATQYNGFGESVINTEYARAISTTNLVTTSPPTMPAAGDAVTGYDRKTITTFDALGRKTSDTILRHYQLTNLTDSQRDIFNAYTYNAEGQLIATNADGVVTQTAYDALGRTLSVTEAERDVLRLDAEIQLQNSALRDLNSSALYERASPYTDMVYDAFGNVVRVTRYANGLRNGQLVVDSSRDQVVLTRYDYQGRAVITTDAQNLKTYNRYDEADHLIESWYTLAGNDGRAATVRTLLTYDAVGHQTSNLVQRETYRTYYGVTTAGATITDAREFVSYNAFGEVINKGFDGSTQPIQFIYNAAGRLQQSNANAGVMRTYGYNLAGYQQNESHKMLVNGSVIDAVTRQTTDKLGRALVMRLPSYTDDTLLQVSVSFKYDRWGNTTEVVDTRGYQTLYQYNQSNQVTQETQALVKVVSETGVVSWTRPVQRWFFDVQGREIANQDANGNIHRSEYDATGRLIRNRGAVNYTTNVTTHAYDALGNERLTQDALNYITFRTFDNSSRITSKGDFSLSTNGYTRTRNTMESYLLNANGDRNVVIDAMGASSKYDYDSRHLLLRSQTAMGVILGYTYDAQGNKISENNALSQAEYGGYLQPRYNGGLVEYQPLIEGQAYSTTIPLQSFITTHGEPLLYEVTVTHSVYENGAYQTRIAPGFVFDANTLTLSNTSVALGTYLVSVTARSSNGGFTTKTFTINAMTTANYNTFVGGAPQLTQGILNQTANVNQAFSYQIPSNTFTDPQGQALTYTMEIGYWVEGWAGIPGEPGDPGYMSYRSLDANDWLQFNAATRNISGTPLLSGGSYQLKLTATDTDGKTSAVEFYVTVNNSYVGSQIQDSEGEWVKPHEQTWDYDAFGRLIDHNDLSGVDYNYTYNSQSAQLTHQSNDWSQTNVNIVNDHYRIGGTVLPIPFQQVSTATGSREMLYYANGQLKELRENGNIYRYAYDAAGNRTMEESEVRDADGDLITLRTRMVYDSHNRLERLTQDEVTGGVVRRILDMVYSYDANGNRRNVQAYGALNTQASVISTANLAPSSVQTVPTHNLRSGVLSVFRLRPSEIFRDPEQDGLTYTAKLVVGGVEQNLPSWLSFTVDTATGEAIFTASNGSTVALGQDLNIKLIATESAAAGSKTASTTFVLSVRSNTGPVLLNDITPSFRAKPGINFQLELAASQYFRDADIGDVLSLTLASGSVLPPGVTLDASNPQALRLIGIPTTPGEYTILLRATDQQGGYVTKSITLNANANVPPAAGSALPSQLWIAGRNSVYQIPFVNAFTDGDADVLTIAATLLGGAPLPSWMTVKLVTIGVAQPMLRFQGEPPADTPDSSSFTFVVTATDTSGASASTNFALLVEQNDVPTSGSVAVQAARVSEAYLYSGNINSLFSDPNGDALTYHLSFAPNDPTAAWLNFSLNTATGAFTLYGTPTSNTQGGPRSVQLIATDVGGLTKALTINFNVKTDTAPTLVNPIPDLTVLKTRNFSYVIPANTFNDADGDSLTYTVYQNVFVPGHLDGEGIWVPDQYELTALPSWMSFDPATRTFRGAAPSTVQTIEIHIEAFDSKGRYVVEVFNLTNSGVATNNGPTLGSALPARSAAEGIALDFPLPAGSFNDANSDQLTYTAQILIGSTWTTLPALGLNIDKYTGRITGVPTSPASTSYSMRITASDGAATVTSANFTMSMNRIPTLSSAFSNRSENVGTTVSWSFTSTKFGDPNIGTTLTYTATGLPPGITFNAGSRTFSGTVTKLGNYTVVVIASDGVLTKQATFTWTVDSPGTDYAPYVANVLVDQGAFQNTQWTYAFPSNTFADANNNPLTYTATLADGSALPAWLSFDGLSRTFNGTPPTLGPISLKVTATDGLYSVNALMTLSVTVPGNTGPTVTSSIPDQLFHKNEGLSFQVPYRSFTDANAGDSLNLTATLGDGSALPSWLIFDPNNGTFYVRPNAPIVFNAFPESHKLPLTIKVTARDASFASTSQTFVLTAVKDNPDSLPSGYVDPFVAADAQKNYWYTYDAENRLLVNHGQLINAGTGQAQIVIGQEDISSGQVYDAVGRMVGRQIGFGGIISVEVSSYNERGMLLNVYQPVQLGQSQSNSALQDHRTYDANGRLLSTTTYFRLAETRETTTAGTYVNIGGWVKHKDNYTYNLDGQVTFQSSYGRLLEWKAAVTPNLVNETGASATVNPLTLLSTVKSIYVASYIPNQIFGYDYKYLAHESGSGVKSTDATNYTHFYRMSYEGRDSYLETGVSGSSTNATFKASTTSSQYDAWGKRLAVREKTPLPSDMGTLDDRVRYFTYDGEGGILRRREGIINNDGFFAQTNMEESRDMLYAFANRQQVAKQSRAGKLDIASLQGMELSGGGNSQTTVQAGENLQAVAQRVYGNSSLWYVLAEANAIGNSEITAGTTLKVPDVGQHKNDATTFKPYNPAETIGNTSPTLPYIEPPKDCNALVMILMVVIVVVVTVFTAGAMTYGVAGMMQGMTGIMGAGMATLGGAAGVGAAVAAGAVGAFAGSVASQAVGSALGETSFSWRGAVASGIAGGLTAGIGATFGGAEGLSSLIKAGSWGKVAAAAALSATSGYVANKIAGVEDTHFSWKAIAASAVTSVIAGKINKKLGTVFEQYASNGIVRDTIGGMVSGVVSLHVRRAFGFDDAINYGNIAADAFGNALANAAMAGVNKAELQQIDEIGSFDLESALDNLAWAKENFSPGSLTADMPGDIIAGDGFDTVYANNAGPRDAGAFGGSGHRLVLREPDALRGEMDSAKAQLQDAENEGNEVDILAAKMRYNNAELALGQRPSFTASGAMDLGIISGTGPDDLSLETSSFQQAAQQFGSWSAIPYNNLARSYNDLGNQVWSWFDSTTLGTALEGTRIRQYAENKRIQMPIFTSYSDTYNGFKAGMLPMNAAMGMRGQSGTWLESYAGVLAQGLNNQIGIVNGGPIGEVVSAFTGKPMISSVPISNRMLSGAALTEFGWLAGSFLSPIKAMPRGAGMSASGGRLATADLAVDMTKLEYQYVPKVGANTPQVPSRIDLLAARYAEARNGGDVFTWERFASEAGVDPSTLNRATQSAIRNRAKEMDLVPRAPVDANRVADFSAWNTEIVERGTGLSRGTTLHLPETTTMPYGRHFDYLDSRFVKPDGYLWDHMAVDGHFQAVQRGVHATTPHKGFSLWINKVD